MKNYLQEYAEVDLIVGSTILEDLECIIYLN